MKPAEKWGLAAAVAGVVVALLAWWFPRAADGPEKPDPTPPPGTAAGPAPTTPPGQPGQLTGGPAVVALDSLPAQSGGANITQPPHALDVSGYQHPLVLSCPSNHSDDKVRETTWSLRGRYLDFSATVRAYAADAQEQDSLVKVTVVAGYKQRDATFDRRQVGQAATSAAGSSPLTGSVEHADEVTLQVSCEYPLALVVLDGAGLTRAD